MSKFMQEIIKFIVNLSKWFIQIEKGANLSYSNKSAIFLFFHHIKKEAKISSNNSSCQAIAAILFCDSSLLLFYCNPMFYINVNSA